MGRRRPEEINPTRKLKAIRITLDHWRIADAVQGVLDLVQNVRIVDGRRRPVGLAVGDLLHGPAQDLAGSRFGQPGHNRRGLERRDRADRSQDRRSDRRDERGERRDERRDGRRERIHDRMDRNDDGKIGRREWKRAKRVHDRIDRNDDGKVGRREWQRAKRVHDRLDRNDDGRVGKRERKVARKVHKAKKARKAAKPRPRPRPGR